MTNLILRFFSIFLLLLSSNKILYASSDISQLVVFGDSYSDNGNTFRNSKNTYPSSAYYLGHFTNGPTWSEYLAIKLGLDIMDTKYFRNYAYGQAQITGKVTLSTHNKEKTWDFSIPDLSGELDEYFADGNIYPDNSLYIVFIGTNDILNYIPSTQKENEKFVNGLVKSIDLQIHRLKKIGAKKIILFKLRDLKESPLAKKLANKYSHNYLATLDKMIQQFNNEISLIYSKDLLVHIYDTYSFDTKILSSITDYEWNRQMLTLSDKQNACYKNDGNYVDILYNQYCANPWAHWFFDRIHVTTYVDFLMSKNIYSYIVNEKLINNI